MTHVRSEASLARLAEMRIDVYVPRSAQRHAQRGTTDTASMLTVATRPRIVLIARAATAGESHLLADIERALAHASIEVQRRDVAAALSAGDMHADASDVLVDFARADDVLATPAESSPAAVVRQRVSAPGLATLHADARSKRLLWHELRRLIARMHDATVDACGRRSDLV